MPEPVDPERTPPAADDAEGDFATSGRIARGAAVRALGEIVAKVATLVFFVLIARELGDDSFGDFVFGISLGQLLLIGAGLGTEELISREVARRHSAIDNLFPNVLAVKRLMLFLLWLVMIVVVLIGEHDTGSTVAIVLVGAGVAVEFQSKTYSAVFQAYEVQQYIAATLIVQRGVTAAAGISVLLAGGNLVAVSIVFFAGSLVGLVVALLLMRGRVVRPSRLVDRSTWRAILLAGAPLGAVIVLYYVIIRLDAVLLSFLSGGGESGNAELGQYGAAFRLVDATMFLSFAFTGAIYPWFSRAGKGPVSVGRGFGLALKIVLAILTPIGIVYVVFATQLIETLYGSEYSDAITPLRYLGAMTIVVGINMVVSVVLIALDRPREFYAPGVLVLIQNLVFNLITIPEYGATAAAANAAFSGVLLATITVIRTAKPFDPIGWWSVFAAPLLAGAVLAGIGFAALPVMPWVLAAALATLGYVVSYLLIERNFFPGDFRFIEAVASRVRERLRPSASP